MTYTRTLKCKTNHVSSHVCCEHVPERERKLSFWIEFTRSSLEKDMKLLRRDGVTRAVKVGPSYFRLGRSPKNVPNHFNPRDVQQYLCVS